MKPLRHDDLVIPLEAPHALDLLGLAAYLQTHEDHATHVACTVLGLSAKTHLPARTTQSVVEYGRAVMDRLVQLGFPAVEVLPIALAVMEEAFQVLIVPPTNEQVIIAGE